MLSALEKRQIAGAAIDVYDTEPLELAHPLRSLDNVLATPHIGYLIRKGRTYPDLDASLFFDPDEIRGAHLLAKKKMPATMPTVNEVVRLIAQIGGFLGRKSDGEPGAKTIWRGLDQVLTAADTLCALREGLG